jgi:hypothetical protein
MVMFTVEVVVGGRPIVLIGGGRNVEVEAW